MDNTILKSGAGAEGNELQFLTFLLGGKVFGIDIKMLKEVIKYVEPGETSTLVKSVDGVIELRGMKVPVIDLRRLFSFGVTVTEKSRIILLLLDRHVIGLIVDEVMDVETLPPGAEVVTPIPAPKGQSGGKGAYLKYVQGVIGARESRDGAGDETAPEPGRDRVVMMLNPGLLLTGEDKSSLFA